MAVLLETKFFVQTCISCRIQFAFPDGYDTMDDHELLRHDDERAVRDLIESAQRVHQPA